MEDGCFHDMVFKVQKWVLTCFDVHSCGTSAVEVSEATGVPSVSSQAGEGC